MTKKKTVSPEYETALARHWSWTRVTPSSISEISNSFYKEFRRDSLVRNCIIANAFYPTAKGFETVLELAEPGDLSEEQINAKIEEYGHIKDEIDGLNKTVGLDHILFETRNLLSLQLGIAMIGLLASGISLRWLVSSAEILDEATDLREAYEEKKAKLDNETITGLIIRMMAYYRDNKPTIQKLSLLSRVAGICFTLNGILALVDIANQIMFGAPLLTILALAIGTVLNFAVGIAGLIIPHFFSTYKATWDYRIRESVKVENELAKTLEGN